MTINDAYTALKKNITALLPAQSVIAIYGTGEAARTVKNILQNDYVIAGFLDRESSSIGKNIFGYNVISFEEAVNKKVRAVVIAANIQYWNVIYKRIKDGCACAQIDVYYTNGEAAQGAAQDDGDAVKNNQYWNVSLEDLEKLCAEYNIISFDIFDTLITRPLAAPSDIFKLAVLNGDDSEFALETEKLCVRPRYVIAKLLKKLAAQKKRIILVSDMYFSAAKLKMLLAKCGIAGFEKIFVSCEEYAPYNSAPNNGVPNNGASKEDGSLWQLVKNYLNGESFLHIGDDILSDIANAQNAGIKTFFVMRPSIMLAESSIGSIAQAAEIEDSTAAGLLQTRLFNNPFALHRRGGTPFVEKPEDYGYCFFGPLVAAFFARFFAELQKNKFDAVLWTARDGWFFSRCCESLKNKYAAGGAMPRGIYFKASRRLVSTASLKTEQDIINSLRLSYNGSSDIFFRGRLGIKPPFEDRHISTLDDDVQKIILDNSKEILQNAAREREAYQKYLKKTLGSAQKIILFDSGQNGTIQYYLQKILERNITGFYIFYAGKSGAFLDGNMNAQALYTEEDKLFSILSKNKAHLESVLTEEKGTYLFAKKCGFKNDVLSANHNSFFVIKKIHNGIIEFINDYYKLIPANLPPKNYFAPAKDFAALAIDAVNNITLGGDLRAALCFEDVYRNGAYTKKQIT